MRLLLSGEKVALSAGDCSSVPANEQRRDSRHWAARHRRGEVAAGHERAQIDVAGL